MVAVVLNSNYTLPESIKDIARETYLPARTVSSGSSTNSGFFIRFIRFMIQKRNKKGVNPF